MKIEDQFLPPCARCYPETVNYESKQFNCAYHTMFDFYASCVRGTMHAVDFGACVARNMQPTPARGKSFAEVLEWAQNHWEYPRD